MLGQGLFPILVLPADAVVADLRGSNSGWWNVFLIDTCFLPSEAQKIKSIPICFMPQEDIIIWPKSKDGKYAVKMGYQILCEMENRELVSASDTEESRKFWAGLWRMKVPNKNKTFAWRACTDSLPTLENLARRKVAQSSICPICNKVPESVAHPLWACENIGLVWGSPFDELRATTTFSLTFANVFQVSFAKS